LSTAKRLAELAEGLSPEVTRSIFGSEGIPSRRWVETRNYYTHWDEELRPKILDGEGMYGANIRMQVFLRVLYLNLIGIPDPALARAPTNASYISQGLVRLNITERRRANPEDPSGAIFDLHEVSTAASVEQDSASSRKGVAATQVPDTSEDSRSCPGGDGPESLR